MLRIYKLYDFDLSMDGTDVSKRVPAVRSSFSSYPGSLFSGDDFYVLSSGLVVQETTIGSLVVGPNSHYAINFPFDENVICLFSNDDLNTPTSGFFVKDTTIFSLVNRF